MLKCICVCSDFFAKSRRKIVYIYECKYPKKGFTLGSKYV